MCGRFVGFRKLEELKSFFPIDDCSVDVTANFNVAPSQKVLAIIRRDERNCLEYFHWGLVPFWAKDQTVGNRMINARAETIASKPSFKNAFRRKRCLIPADGFYEWKGTKGKKQPMFITRPDQAPFAFAGLWESWQGPDPNTQTYLSCTIITTEASDAIKKIHHRMPAVLQAESYTDWLNPELTEPQEVMSVLTHRLQTEFVSRAVSTRVNHVANNGPENIAAMQQMSIEF